MLTVRSHLLKDQSSLLLSKTTSYQSIKTYFRLHQHKVLYLFFFLIITRYFYVLAVKVPKSPCNSQPTKNPTEYYVPTLLLDSILLIIPGLWRGLRCVWKCTALWSCERSRALPLRQRMALASPTLAQTSLLPKMRHMTAVAPQLLATSECFSLYFLSVISNALLMQKEIYSFKSGASFMPSI